jgi:hypothetical protein
MMLMGLALLALEVWVLKKLVLEPGSPGVTGSRFQFRS